jgi:hypothetical protein
VRAPSELERRVEAPVAVDVDEERIGKGEGETWVVVLVRGTDGVSRPLWPLNPLDLPASGNRTLDDLVDGNLGEGPGQGARIALELQGQLEIRLSARGAGDVLAHRSQYTSPGALG